MAELIGFTDAFVHLPTKRDVLLFDRVGAAFLHTRLTKLPAAGASEIERLQAAGALFETDASMLSGIDEKDPQITHDGDLTVLFALADVVLREIRNSPSQAWHIASHRALREHIAALSQVGSSNNSERLERRLHRLVHHFLDSRVSVTSEAAAAEARRLRIIATSHLSRLYAQHFQRTKEVDAVSMLTDTAIAGLGEQLSGDTVVLHAVLKMIPEPSPEVEWERILEFRSDPDARLALRRLRRWMLGISGERKNEREVTDELQYLIDQYSEYLKLHRLKTQPGIVETIITVGLGVAENLVKLKFADAAQKLFELRTRKIALLEAEQKAPGREIAYIIQATHALGGGA